jgi:alkanesulfonate monooxygenase SsuD/methylene tetrahydromethanopterin reductase-like flavin-dependent oxidoreductase (luciferase family)
MGYESGPEQRGYLIRCHVAETEEKALKGGEEFRWMQRGERKGSTQPEWLSPPGYSSAAARLKLRRDMEQQRDDSYQNELESGSIIAGTPDQVIKQLKVLLEETRPSILSLYANHGRVNHEDSMTCIRLLGEEVAPAIREIGKELGLSSPFELNSPVSLDHTKALNSNHN